MYDDNDIYEMPETSATMPESSATEIIEKIQAMAMEIRCDWSDPRRECREISRLCDKLKEMLAKN
jgi:hypothetical protein